MVWTPPSKQQASAVSAHPGSVQADPGLQCVPGEVVLAWAAVVFALLVVWLGLWLFKGRRWFEGSE